jgi:hypothetical protein
MFSGAKGITKLCAIRLQLGGEHIFWYFVFTVQHACHYCCSETMGCDWCG